MIGWDLWKIIDPKIRLQFWKECNPHYQDSLDTSMSLERSVKYNPNRFRWAWMVYIALYAVRIGVMTYMFYSVIPHKTCAPFKSVTILMDYIFTCIVQIWVPIETAMAF